MDYKNQVKVGSRSKFWSLIVYDVDVERLLGCLKCFRFHSKQSGFRNYDGIKNVTVIVHLYWGNWKNILGDLYLACLKKAGFESVKFEWNLVGNEYAELGNLELDGVIVDGDPDNNVEVYHQRKNGISSSTSNVIVPNFTSIPGVTVRSSKSNLVVSKSASNDTSALASTSINLSKPNLQAIQDYNWKALHSQFKLLFPSSTSAPDFKDIAIYLFSNVPASNFYS